MELHSSSFDRETIERLGMGAGIIPFARGPDNTRMFLLGRERFCSQWKGSLSLEWLRGLAKGRRAGRGHRVPRVQGGILCILPDIDAATLERRDYWIRVVLRIANERQAERYHSTYLVEIPSRRLSRTTSCRRATTWSTWNGSSRSGIMFGP